MTRSAVLAVAILCVFAQMIGAADAKPRHIARAALTESGQCLQDNNGRTVCPGSIERTGGLSRVTARYAERGDPRPSAWCAWWLRRKLGIPKSAFPPYQYNLARAFAKLGSPAPKGCVNCIGIFSRGRGGHVGIVEGWDANGNPVLLSGNFNGGVGVAPHPASRLIALRWLS